MPTGHTAHFKERTRASSGEEPVVLLEIDHPELLTPQRVVNDTDDLVSNGNNYVACGFQTHMPDDVAGAMPRVPIAIDNLGGEMTEWLDASKGGRGATVRMMQVMRDTPNVIEQEFTLELLNSRQSPELIEGELGYENVLDQPALQATYTPETAPGLF